MREKLRSAGERRNENARDIGIEITNKNIKKKIYIERWIKNKDKKIKRMRAFLFLGSCLHYLSAIPLKYHSFNSFQVEKFTIIFIVLLNGNGLFFFFILMHLWAWS